jgi:hypothetical protein
LYDTAFVSYGNLTLVVDEYRSDINQTTQTGKPPGWPNVAANITTTWNAGAVSWNPSDPIKKELSDIAFLRNVTSTNSTSKDWIRMDWVISQIEKDSSNRQSSNAPRFAHVPHAFVRRTRATASKIQANFTFLIIVIVCNVVKLATMVWVVFMEHKDYIVTLGDGAASFLEHPDPTTQRMCILSKPEITREVAAQTFKHYDRLATLLMEIKMTWNTRFITYSNARNRDREVGTYFL